MPTKGSKKAKTGQEGQEEIPEETSAGQTEEPPQVPENLAERLVRIESILETLAAKAEADSAPKRRILSPTVMTTRQKSARTKASGTKKSAANKDQEVPPVMDDVIMQENDPVPIAAALLPQQTPAMTSSNFTGHHQSPYVNNAPMTTDFNSWLLSKTPAMNPQFSQQYMPMASRDFHNNSDIDARVHQIIANSATNIAKGTSQQGLFPFKYVTRGHDKVKPTINSITALEHLWGLFAIIKDPTVPSGIKPAILTHMDEILEDCRWYEWESAVRPWSEEVFSLIAEGRLPLGWEDTKHIQMLRMTISRASTARIYGNRGQLPRIHQPQSQQQHNPAQSHPSHEQMKGGPPCPQYNSQQGCHLQSGHSFKGKKMIHVCSFCIAELSVPYPHPIINCRNKARAETQQHFH